jgi:hypothetical protein
MQHGDLSPLIELNTEIAEEVVSPEKAHQHRPESGREFDRGSSNRSDERGLSLMVVTKPSPGINPVFLAVREVDP